MSQAGLSKAVGMSPAYIAQLESGGILKPSYETMAEMARALRVPLAWLAEGEGAEPDWSDAPPDTERAAS
jgi:transcriptional regulator with XRE-family HTH domain